MSLKSAKRDTHLYVITAVILLVGLGCAGLIYLSTDASPDVLSGNEPEYSKMYNHDLELYGGKANVLASEFSRWFAGLWHGRSLACTVAFITFFSALGFFLGAKYLNCDLKSESGDKNVSD